MMVTMAMMMRTSPEGLPHAAEVEDADAAQLVAVDHQTLVPAERPGQAVSPGHCQGHGQGQCPLA